VSGSEETIPRVGFGEYLRREREMRGVSLEEISTATKISIRFLQAIEDEELSRLPGGIFTRSFVRTYARYLGLDEERVMADCQLADQQRPEIDIRRITANRARPDKSASRTRIIALLVAVVLLAIGYALFHYSRRIMEQQTSAPVVIPPSTTTGATNPTTATSSATNPSPEAAPVQSSAPAQSENNTLLSTGPASGTAGAATAPGASPAGSASPGAKANPPNQNVTSEVTSAIGARGDLVLQVAASQRTWVAVDADGKTVLQKVLNPNEVQNLKAHESFDVTIGHAQGVVLTLNGETLKPLGRGDEVKSIHLTRDDLKNAAHER